MPQPCKNCGGKYTFNALDKKTDPLHAGMWACESCGNQYLQRRRKPKHKNGIPKGQSFNPLQVGIAIGEYLRKLETEVAELKECVEDRDRLQKQVYSLQEKVNEYKLNSTTDTKMIHIPLGIGQLTDHM